LSLEPGSLSTYMIFVDLPVHIEFKVHPMPLMPEGVSIRFDKVSLRDPGDVRRVREVDGEYHVLHRRLVYSPSLGMLQYLEMSPGRVRTAG